MGMKFKVVVCINKGAKVTMCKFLRMVTDCRLREVKAMADTMPFDCQTEFTLFLNEVQTARLATAIFADRFPIAGMHILLVEEVKPEVGTDLRFM